MINKKNAREYCKDDIKLIENYDIAVNSPDKWECHHRRETIYSRDGLKAIGEYLKRPATELIFMPYDEHRKFHHCNKIVSKSTREKIGKSKLGNKYGLGHHKSDDAKERISAAAKLRLSDPANREKIAVALSTQIIQLTKSGEFIKEWPSMQEAARELGIAQSNISRVCNHKRNYAGGFIWEFKQKDN